MNEVTGFIFALATFAAGFAVRPFGALVFGRLGDLVGRKHTFLITMSIMGGATFLVGLLPSYASAGLWAPIALVVLRLLQGLALGGEYGGAATYVAEHAPPGKRGLYTSWIQTTATLGLFAALLVVIGTRTGMGEDAFKAWGWRIPFLVSLVLLVVSLWIRMKLDESPVFMSMKEAGSTSKAPLAEAFGRWSNLKIVLIALLGAVMGQAVVWYTGQFYALFFLERILRVDGATTNILTAIALALATPAFIFFGWLSDRIGRKPIILAGCLLAAITYTSLFHALTLYANPTLAAAQASAPVTVIADPAQCSVQFDPVGKNKFDSTSCDIAKSFLAKAGVSYQRVAASAGKRRANQGRRDDAHCARSAPAQRRGPQDSHRRVSGFGKEGTDRRRLPGQGRPGVNQQTHGGADSLRARVLRDHGVRTHRRAPRRTFSGAHPLQRHVPALSHR